MVKSSGSGSECDLGEELAVGVHVDRSPDAGARVDLRLQLVAGVQQSLVLRGRVGDDLVDAPPRKLSGDIGARQGFIVLSRGARAILQVATTRDLSLLPPTWQYSA